ncbi:isoleucine--tRNA ligase [Agrobacterium salinitolerans]|nr:isoleucine--tRNA ligase [Agrobacterium salinitolerans]
MSSSTKSHDYSSTLALPANKMPMKASPGEKETELLARWEAMDLYGRLRSSAEGKPRFTLHDGPPYANGHLHMGHALNKVLKDVVVRSHQMTGFDAAYVPGWDCHGLPIEWKVEEGLRAEGRTKEDVSVTEFRGLCREFAGHWRAVQATEFERLGVAADFRNPYTTMAFEAEATIASELMKFVESGLLYRGSKPVMWSVVERTALAEAEVEHKDYTSDAVWVKFPVATGAGDMAGAHVVVWTTTPWTLPGNRAVAFSPKGGYGLFEVVAVEREFGPRVGERFLLSLGLADQVSTSGKLSLALVRDVSVEELEELECGHPLAALGYRFRVPLLAGEHVTHDSGTGFVHTAPGHGTDDFDLWTRSATVLEARGVATAVPFTVDDAGFLTDAAPGFGPSSEGGPARVLDDAGNKGDANERVVSALIKADALVTRSRYKHAYPHSWRSGKPVVFRNTPQWFVYMDKELGDGTTLRSRSLDAVSKTEFVPETGRNRLNGMVDSRPDWVLSRQRRWGVPVTVFHDAEGNVLVDPVANAKVVEAFRVEGADAWFVDGAKDRFLSHRDDVGRWSMVQDILDVWFDSGCTHAFVLGGSPDGTPAADVYMEGSDQHRGWFQSSLLESCATRGHAPFKKVVTHGFVMGEDGMKMAKSSGKALSPQSVVDKHGADVLRMWVVLTDYKDDVRLGDGVLKSASEAFRKMRNTFRWMVGMLDHWDGRPVALGELPELERLMLHRLTELDVAVRDGYARMDFKRVVRTLSDFMNVELSSFYFGVRKDALYCDAPSSHRRQAGFFVLAQLFRCLAKWLAPMLPFLAEEVWLAAYPASVSVHLEQFEAVPAEWADGDLSRRWETVMACRSLVNVALERARKAGDVGSSLEARPVVYVENAPLMETLGSVDLAEVCVTSGLQLVLGGGPDEAVKDEALTGVSVMAHRAAGSKCARSWVVSDDVGSDPDYPDVSARDAAALRELAA